MIENSEIHKRFFSTTMFNFDHPVRAKSPLPIVSEEVPRSAGTTLHADGKTQELPPVLSRDEDRHFTDSKKNPSTTYCDLGPHSPRHYQSSTEPWHHSTLHVADKDSRGKSSPDEDRGPHHSLY